MQEDAAIEQLSAYLDGELTETEVAELELRLARDSGLRAELESLRGAVDLLRTHGPVQAPPALYGDILRAVEDEPMPGGWWAWLQRPFGMPLPTLALAGVAMAVVGVSVGGAVVATAPGVLRPAVADLDYDDASSAWSTRSEVQKDESKIAAKAKKEDNKVDISPDQPAERADAGDGVADVDGEVEDTVDQAEAAVAQDSPGSMLGSADDGSVSTASSQKKLVDKAAYGGSGTMYSGGPIVSVGLKPEDLERVAALYQRFAGTRDSRANSTAQKLANLPEGTNSVTLNLPDAQARNAFEQELKKAFPGSFQSAPASEDGFTLDHARMRLKITVADQFPGSAGGEIEQPPLQMLRKGKIGDESANDAMEMDEGSSSKE